MKKIYVVLFIHICTILPASGQVGQQWVQRYNGPGNYNDIPYAMTIDASGNIYLTGTSYSNSTVYDIATIKYNSAGVQQWLTRYTGFSHDAAYAIAVDNSGNVYVTGSSNQGLGSDYVTIKYNSSGIQQWIQFYEGPAFEEDIAASVAVDISGNVYVSGSSTGFLTNLDYTTIKYNSGGAEQWIQRYKDSGDVEDAVTGLVMDASGNIYVTGRSNYDYTTIKYNPAGVQQWLQSYNGPGNSSDSPSKIVIDGSDNIYITGLSLGTNSNYDYATIKYNSAGVQQWASRYDNNNFDYAQSLAVDGSGNVFVTGSSLDNYATVKYNSSGVQQWVQFYNGPGNAGDQARSIAVDAIGNVYVTGYSFGTSVTQYDIATIKYNTSGIQQWLQRYNGPGDFYDIPSAVSVDVSGNICVAGQSGGLGTGLDYAVIKYAPITGVNHSEKMPETYRLYQNYPNPFNPSTKIKFSIGNSPLERGKGGDLVKLTIYDIIGKEITTLINQQLQPGTYEVEWDGSDYPSGVYFYTIKTESFTETKKMLLIK